MNSEDSLNQEMPFDKMDFSNKSKDNGGKKSDQFQYEQVRLGKLMLQSSSSRNFVRSTIRLSLKCVNFFRRVRICNKIVLEVRIVRRKSTPPAVEMFR